MFNTARLALGVSFLLLLAGCPRDEVPQPAPEPEAAPGTRAQSEYRGPGDASAAGRIRITLDADGGVIQIEGMDAGSNWEPELMQMTDAPESLGEKIATVDVYGLNESIKELVKPENSNLSAHAHAIQTNPPYNTHCHRWIVSQGKNVLVHC